MTPMKKALWSITTSLLMLALLLAGTISWLLSASGSNWLIQTTISRLQLPLTVAPLESGIGSSLSINAIHYFDQNFDIKLDRIRLDWRPAKLLQGQLWIDQLIVQGLAIDLAQQPAESDADTPALLPLELPAIPLTLELGLLQLDGFSLSQQRSPLLELIQAKLSASATLPQIEIRQLQLEHTLAQLQLDGTVQLAQQLPLQLNLDWTLQHPEYGNHQGQAQLEGDLDQLAIQHQLQGPANAQLALTLTQPLEQLSWHATLQLDSLDSDWILPERQNERYQGTLSAQGDLTSLQAQGTLEGAPAELGETALTFKLEADNQSLQLEQIRLQRPLSDSDVTISGRISNWQHRPDFDLTGNWKNLRYPLDGVADFSSPVGRYQVNGNLDRFKLSLDAPLRSPHSPDLQLTLNGTASQQGFEQFQLLGQLPRGQLEISGKLGWQPHLSWGLLVNATGVDPALLYPEWPGLIHLDASTQGQYKEHLNVDIDIQQLDGELKGELFDSHAGLSYFDNVLQLHQLELQSNQLTLLASGVMDDQLHFNYQLDARRLDTLLPELSGQLHAEGSLQGTPSAPVAIASMTAHKLQYQDSRVENLSLQLDVDLSGQQHSQLQLEADRLSHQQLSWDHLNVTADGSASQHQFELKLQGGDINMDLTASGAANETHWKGQLTELALHGEDIGAWALHNPVAAELSSTHSQLSALCLNQHKGDAKLCAQATWQPAGTTLAELNLQGLPLPFLAPWLPPETEISGLLYSTAKLSMEPNSTPTFTLDARTETGSIQLIEQATLTLQQFQLSANGDQQGVDGKLELTIPEINAHLSSSLQIAQPDQIGSGQSPIKGQLDLQVEELAIISQLFPELSQVKGHIDGKLELSGELQSPRIIGHLELNNAEMEIPALGTRLESVEIKLDSQAEHPETMTFRGQAHSGSGALQLDGQLQLSNQQLDLQLSGQNFEAIATDTATIQVSPQLTLSLSPELSRLSGQVTIPWARLTPPDLSNAVSSSRDAKILQQQRQAKAIASTFEADLDLILGDDVQAKGFGFEGNLKGKIRLQEDSIRATRASGDIEIESGIYEIYGQELNIERGRFVYTGGAVDNPGLDLKVLREIDTVKVGATIGGDLREPKIQLLSEPTMPDASVLSYLLLGRAPGNTESNEQTMMLRAALALGAGGSNKLAERLTSTLRLDELKIDTGNEAEDAALYIGKYLSPKIYVRYGVGLMVPDNSLFLRYTLDEQWKLESQSSSEKSGTDVFYTLER
ncbi:MAG: translocation/assembly module TamB domain-containing protein [Halopseudomonas sp.]